jgi:hypothetical protein
MTGERLQLQVIFPETGRIEATTADPRIACCATTGWLVPMTMAQDSLMDIINTPLGSSAHVEQLLAR